MGMVFLGFFEIFNSPSFRGTAEDYVKVSCYVSEQLIRQWDGFEGKVTEPKGGSLVPKIVQQ
jgi:hypothetical protein